MEGIGLDGLDGLDFKLSCPCLELEVVLVASQDP